VTATALAAALPAAAATTPDDLVITSSTSLSVAGPGPTMMTVTNLGETPAEDIELPATAPGSADVGVYDAATGIWTIARLDPGATATLSG
jgi:hypothetical protein